MGNRVDRRHQLSHPVFVFYGWSDQPSDPANAEKFLQCWHDGHEVQERANSLDCFDVLIYVLVFRQVPEGFSKGNVRDHIKSEVL